MKTPSHKKKGSAKGADNKTALKAKFEKGAGGARTSSRGAHGRGSSELDTSKEELESSNEEMSNRNLELSRLNSDLSNLQRAAKLVVVLLGRDLTIRRFSVQAEKQFNLSTTDLGRSFHGIRHDLEVPDLETVLSDVIANVRETEREIQDKAGRWFSLRVRPYLTVENKVDGAVLVLLDIDALKRAEQKATEAHLYARAVIDDSPPLLVLDTHLRVISSNQSFFKHFKVLPEQTEKILIYDLGNGQWNIPQLRTFLEEILPRDSFFNDFEIVHDFETIGRRTMRLSGHRLDHLQQILLFINDVTEQVEIQDRVRASELRYRRLFETAKDGILILDPNTRKVTEANPCIADMLAYKREELVGKELWEIGLLKDKQANKAAFQELKAKHTIRYDSLPLETKAGRVIQVEFVSNLYRENDKAVIQCNIRDVSERKQTEEALRVAQAQLADRAAQLQQLVADRTARLQDTIEELEHFSYTITHDMRAPLRALQGFATLLRSNPSAPLTPERADYLRRITDAADRMDALIRDSLQYAKIVREHLPLTSVEPEPILRGILESYPALQPEHAEIEVVEPLPPVLANAAGLGQCFSNLLTNAIKFIKSGITPKIRIWAEIRQETSFVSQSTNPPGPQFVPAVRFWFEDNGIGIPPQYQDRIFGMFQQLDKSYEGTGIGLALVRKTAERMEGKAGVESEPGKGSRFWLEFKKVPSPTTR